MVTCIEFNQDLDFPMNDARNAMSGSKLGTRACQFVAAVRRRRWLNALAPIPGSYAPLGVSSRRAGLGFGLRSPAGPGNERLAVLTSP